MGIKFANLASTALASDVNATTTSISVTSASSFPPLGSGDYFYASIGFGSDSEIVKVTAVAGDTFTVVRAQDDTSASAHTSGDEVALRVTAKALEDINESANQTITLSGDVSGSGTDTISVSVTNDSHTHAFNNLTGKDSGTGLYSTTGNVEAGRGSGGVALTHNDGYGNANVTFNHRNGSPEQTGNAGRIEVNTDAAEGDVYMSFEGKSAVSADTATGLNTMMQLGVGSVKVPYKIEHIGDDDTFIAMEDNKVYIKTGNQLKWNSDNWTSNTEASVEFTFAGGLKTDEITASSTSQSGGQQQLVLNAGESQGKVVDSNGDSTQTQEFVYINAEGGLSVNTPDSDHSNWQSGYSVDTTIIKGTSITVDGNTVWHAGNDGSGSGLDADKLDNLHSTSFLRSDADDSSNSILTLSGANHHPLKIHRTTNANAGIVFENEDGNGDINYRTYFGLGNASGELTVGDEADTQGTGHKIWHEGNDGADSGLDADKLDGKHASEFPLVANGTVTGDFNNYTTAGNYIVSDWNPSGGTPISNGPTYTFNTNEVQNAYGWGMLRVSNFAADSNNYIIQEYIPHQDDGIWVRVYWGSHGWNDWRQQYTNESDGNSDGLNADTLDGQEGSYYLDYTNFTNKPTIPSISGLATETYVDSAVADLVATAPDALNTLNELAAAINDDASFATTVNTNIAAKVSKTGDTMTGNLAIELASPTITLKDTSDDDDHAIYFTDSTGSGISTIKSTTAVTGSTEDAFTFDSIRDIVFTRDNTNEKLRIKDGGVDVAGDLDVAERIYTKGIRTNAGTANTVSVFSVRNQADTVNLTVIDNKRNIQCEDLTVGGDFQVSGSNTSNTLAFYGGTTSSDPARLEIKTIIEGNTAQGDVYSALEFGVVGGETSEGNLTDGTIAAVKAIDCRSGSTSYEDGGLGFYTTDHDDANHKLRGYFGNSGGLHVTNDEGIEDNIPSGDIKADGAVIANGGLKIGGSLVITSGKVLQNVTANASVITAGAFHADRIPSLPASKITSGSFDAARIPSLAASKITSGSFDAARIPSLAASKITSGSFDAARIPSLPSSKITSGTFAVARIPVLDAAKIGSGTFGTARIPNLAASKINSGTFNVSRLPETSTPARATELNSSQDLDDLNAAQAGFYYQQANADTPNNNYPSGHAGSLIVQKSAGNATQLYQTYSDSTPRLYFRSNYNAGYGSWQRVFADNYHPNADKWTTARTITVQLTGDVTGSASATIDGSVNQTISISTTGGGVVDSIANFADNRIITASDADSLNGEANLTFNGSTLSVTGTISTSTHGTSQNWYDAYVVSQNALSKSVTTEQNITGPVVHNGDVKINDGLHIEVGSSDYTKFLRVERNGGTGATLAVLETTGTYASSLQFRTFYNGFTMHNQNYTGFSFQNGYIAPSANQMGYLGDGTVHLGSSSYAWGNIYTQDCLYTQEDGAGLSMPRKAFSCRAWASIRQTSTTTILKDQGISSVTDQGTGRTKIFFSESMPDANYCVTASAQIDDLSSDANDVTSVSVRYKLTTSVEIINEDIDGVNTDSPNLSVVIHR